MLTVKKKASVPNVATARILKFPRASITFTPSKAPAGKCRLLCGRDCTTHSKTSICATCLADLSKKRNQTEAERLRYKQRTSLRVAREAELITHPKGYRFGRPEVSRG